MKKILGIFRGFPGLGRVVSGISLLETLKERYGYDIRIITYLQGNRYLELKGYTGLQEAVPMDYCSIGLLPTNKMGSHIHQTVKEFKPDVIVVDGEPLIIQSIKLSHKQVKVVALLNPADVDNPSNEKEAMDFFNNSYSLADLAVIHGLREITPPSQYRDYISVGTIIRNEVIEIENHPQKDIYCLLGGGTYNVGHQFSESTIRIGELCMKVAYSLPSYKMHIVCSSQNIYDALSENVIPRNVIMHNQVLNPSQYYSDACLIISRSGRNTLSELAYLGIPAISFISGCIYRIEEQKQNMESLSDSNIISASLDINPDDLKNLCLQQIGKENRKNNFECGNEKVIEQILSL